MNWFFIALIGPLLYAVTNHIDKYILEKYFKAGEVGALVLFSALSSAVALPVVYFIEPGVFAMGLTSITLLTVSGILSIVCLILYFYALEEDEASMVVPFYQTIPVFGFILGYVVLGETLSPRELTAGLLILAGTTVISLDLRDGTIRFKKKVASLMTLSSLLFAIIGVVFKMVAVDEGFWQSAFWSLVGDLIIGTALFFAVKSYRQQFLDVFRANSAAVLSINSANELIFMAADGVTAYATLLAPIALVMTINSLQPIFVFLIGIILTLFLPHLGKESMTRNHLTQKAVAIGIITVGTCLLNLNRP